MRKDAVVMDPRAVLVVAAGAAIGGVLRYVVTSVVVARYGAGLGFIATLGINVSGSLAIGFVLEASSLRATFDPLLRAFLAIGVLGGYTTFSSFSFEALRMTTQGLTITALAYISGSVGFGIAGAYLGIVLARVVFR